MTKLQELREAIIRVVPGPKRLWYRKIGIVEVLYALRWEKKSYAIDTRGQFYVWTDELKFAGFNKKWDNLAKPLEQQSNEVIHFLHGIICQK